MNATEQTLAEWNGYKAVGEGWRRRPTEPEQRLVRDSRSIQLPGL